MEPRSLLILFSLWALGGTGIAQHIPGPNSHRVVFYNVENFFHPGDEQGKEDGSFTPEGDHRWEYWKYHQKKERIFEALTLAGEWKIPDLIGLAEVENRSVLEDLVHQTPLENVGYCIVQFPSPDKRGIDVALLYRKNRFHPLYKEQVRVRYEKEGGRPTRDILYVKGIMGKKDTIHVFVNHWPSRWGGRLYTEWKRVAAARTMKEKVDSLFGITEPSPNILIMGDFNDNPSNKSLNTVLEADLPGDSTSTSELINLMGYEGMDGTHVHGNKWSILDQFIVSRNLVDKDEKGLKASRPKVIMTPELLEENDDPPPRMTPYRSFMGPVYHGGYSDHLPIILDLFGD